MTTYNLMQALNYFNTEFGLDRKYTTKDIVSHTQKNGELVWVNRITGEVLPR